MGVNKALVLFKGQPLITRVINRLASNADEVLITSNEPQSLSFLAFPIYPDLIPGMGALGGLYTALHYARYPSVMIVATDMPFASPVLFQKQLEILQNEGMDLVVPVTNEGYEPFHAVFRRETCLEAVKSALDDGQRRMISWFPKVKVRTMSIEEVHKNGVSQQAFLNVNTQDDLHQAEMLEDKSSS